VITGGASGIGLALAKAYGQRGASVLLADRDESALETAAASLGGAGVETRTHLLDLRTPAAIAELVERASALGPLGAVCLNAGISGGGENIWASSGAAFEFVFEINFWALLESMKAFVPPLIDQDRPADLVVTTSLAGLISLPGSGSYAASKAAATALARVLRAELATLAPKVRVACLAPAMVSTNLARTTAAQQPREQKPDEESVERTHTALNTLGTSPDDVATWVLDALDAGRFWVLSRADNPYMGILARELEELRTAMAAVTS
jgi:NADP-dependent 3-hydroxy acid dehydrogenase YdfG